MLTAPAPRNRIEYSARESARFLPVAGQHSRERRAPRIHLGLPHRGVGACPDALPLPGPSGDVRSASARTDHAEDAGLRSRIERVSLSSHDIASDVRIGAYGLGTDQVAPDLIPKPQEDKKPDGKSDPWKVALHPLHGEGLSGHLRRVA